MKEEKHIFYFDILRFAAMLGVIYMHTCATPLRGEVGMDWQLMNVLVSLSHTAVPLFFMMSGYLMLSSKKTGDISCLIKKRVPRLLCPLIVWSLVAAAIRIYFKDNITEQWVYKKIFYGLHGPVEIHFWYMYALIALYLVSPFIKRAVEALTSKEEKLLMVLLILPSVRNIIMAFMPEHIKMYFDSQIIRYIEFVDGNLTPFILGYYLGRTDRKFKNGTLCAVLAVFLIIVTIGTYKLTVSGGKFDQTFQNQKAGFEIFMAAAVFLLAKNICPSTKTRTVRILTPFVSLSLPVYLMHNLVIACFLENDIVIKTFGDTLGYTLLNFVICISVLFVIASVKPLCFAFTGMTYKKACQTCNVAAVYGKIKKRGYQKSSDCKTLIHR